MLLFLSIHRFRFLFLHFLKHCFLFLPISIGKSHSTWIWPLNVSQVALRDWFSSIRLAFSWSFLSYSLRRRWSCRTRRSRLRISSYPSNYRIRRCTIILCSESVRIVPGCKIDSSCLDCSSLKHSSCSICLEISSFLSSFCRSVLERRESPESSAMNWWIQLYPFLYKYLFSIVPLEVGDN